MTLKRPPDQRITIADVARHAGVSPATVSRVLNRTATVLPETRAQVEQAIEELGYAPDGIAQSLRRGRTLSIGVLLPDIVNTFYAEVARAIEDTASTDEYSVILCHTDENPEKEQQYLRVLSAKRTAGIILSPTTQRNPALAECLRQGIPVIEVDRRSGHGLDAVVVDNEAGAYELVHHLITLGHRRIAAITGPLDHTTATERLRGYQRALLSAGIEQDPTLIRVGDFRAPSGYQHTLELMQQQKQLGFTALFVANNAMATGAIDALRQVGAVIPDSLAFVIFDDPEWARLVTPPVTAVQQPAYRMGAVAADLLLRKLHGRETSQKPGLVKLHPHLVVRESCGAGPRQTGGSS